MAHVVDSYDLLLDLLSDLLIEDLAAESGGDLQMKKAAFDAAAFTPPSLSPTRKNSGPTNATANERAAQNFS
jgi:hypothetical protein